MFFVKFRFINVYQSLPDMRIQNDASTNIKFYKLNQDTSVFITAECVDTETCIKCNISTRIQHVTVMETIISAIILVISVAT